MQKATGNHFPPLFPLPCHTRLKTQTAMGPCAYPRRPLQRMDLLDFITTVSAAGAPVHALCHPAPSKLWQLPALLLHLFSASTWDANWDASFCTSSKSSETGYGSKITRFLPSPSRANFIAGRVFPWYSSRSGAALQECSVAPSLAQSSLLPVICHLQPSSPQPLSSLSGPRDPAAPSHLPSAWFPHKGA